MYTLLAHIVRLLTSPSHAASPRQLMEHAGARAGQNPCHARELRQAARAWLSVVR